MGLPNPYTDLPNQASPRPTNSFHERYASDAEFKRQVDEGRKRIARARDRQKLVAALETSQNGKGKLY